MTEKKKERLISRAVSMGYSQKRAVELADLFLNYGGLGACLAEPNEFSFLDGKTNFVDVLLAENML